VRPRVLWLVLVFWVIPDNTYLVPQVIPAHPAAAAAGFGATPAQIHALAVKMGLQHSLLTQYADYLKGLVFHVDLGTSISTGDAVRTDIANYLPATLELVVISFAIYLILAVLLGTLAARKPGGVTDGMVRVLAILSSAAPVFWIALLLQLVFFAKLNWLPSGGRLDTFDTPPPKVTGFYTIDALIHGQFPTFLAALDHMIIPVAAIVLSLLGIGVRLIRASVLEELDQAYVRTAEAKGLRARSILVRHVLRNALNPFVSMSGIQLGYLFAWIILVETIVQWPGIGLYAYQSFQSLDYNPIMGITLVVSVIFVVLNFLIDLLYPLLDPRVRTA
jgi:ABC-type dipeptide/oligopeptide/nickel transport system permease component